MRQATFDDNEKSFLQVTETSFSQAVSLLQISIKSIIFYKKNKPHFQSPVTVETADGGENSNMATLGQYLWSIIYMPVR